MNAIQALSQLSYSPETVIISVRGYPLSRRHGILYNPQRFQLNLYMRFIFKLIVYAVILGVIYLGVAVFRGGSDIRRAGDVIATAFDGAADTADRIRRVFRKTDSTIERVGDRLNDAAHDAADKLRDTKERINDKAEELKGRADEKAQDIGRVKDSINKAITNSIDTLHGGGDRNAAGSGDKR